MCVTSARTGRSQTTRNGSNLPTGYTATTKLRTNSFPDASVHAVLRLLNVLETLLERHNDATAPLETQCLRQEIHSVGRRLDAVAQQCAERSEPITPVRHQQWRSEERSGIPERNSRIQ